MSCIPSNVPLSVQLAGQVIFGQQVLSQPIAQLLSMGPETALDAEPVPCLVRFPQHPSVLGDLGLQVAHAAGRRGRECRCGGRKKRMRREKKIRM